MTFHCRRCGSVQLTHEIVELGDPQVPMSVVEMHCARCRELLLGRPFTTAPVTYDDLLVELSRKDADVTHLELAFLLSRPETQVLAALMDLRSAKLAWCLDLDLEDREAGEPEGRWVAAGTLEQLRTRAWFDDTYFDLSQDIALSSSLDGRSRHAWSSADLLKRWPPELSALAR